MIGVRPIRPLYVLLVSVCVACSAVPSAEDFCDQAVPILSRSDLGDDPNAMLGQMDDLTAALEFLPAEQSADLRAEIEALTGTLDEAVAGRAENGWSNDEVVQAVTDLCGGDGLISWFVQP